MTNLYKETLSTLAEHGKTIQDVVWVGDGTLIVSLDDLDVEYDDGFGGQEVASDLKVVGVDWWLERAEYDGSEWWAFKEMPIKSTTASLLKSPHIADGCWDTLLDLNKGGTDG